MKKVEITISDDSSNSAVVELLQDHDIVVTCNTLPATPNTEEWETETQEEETYLYIFVRKGSNLEDLVRLWMEGDGKSGQRGCEIHPAPSCGEGAAFYSYVETTAEKICDGLSEFVNAAMLVVQECAEAKFPELVISLSKLYEYRSVAVSVHPTHMM